MFAQRIYTATALEITGKPGNGKMTACQGGHFTYLLFKLIIHELLVFLGPNPDFLLTESIDRKRFLQKGLKMFPNFGVGAHTVITVKTVMLCS